MLDKWFSNKYLKMINLLLLPLVIVCVSANVYTDKR